MAGFGERFGAENVKQVPSVMGGEDFSQFKRAAADDVQSLIFWVGGVRHGEFERAEAAGIMLPRSEEHTSELQSLMRISSAVFCLKKKKKPTNCRTNIATSQRCTRNITSHQHM